MNSKRRERPGYQYYNAIKDMLKEDIRNGVHPAFLVKNMDLNLRKLLYFAAIKKKCYIENIIEIALRQYFEQDKTLAPFLNCGFEVEFAESLVIRKADLTAEPKEYSSKVKAE